MRTDIESVRRHAVQVVGPLAFVLSEHVSDAISLDLLVVPPDRRQPFYSVITCGMSAWKMNPSTTAQEAGVFPPRIELSICLPPAWDFEPETLHSNEDYHWPLRLLKGLARLPLTFGTSLGIGHTVASRNLESYASSTKFCAALISYPALFRRKPKAKSNLGDITFLHVVPLFKAELDFVMTEGMGRFLARMDKARIGLVIEPTRRRSEPALHLDAPVSAHTNSVRTRNRTDSAKPSRYEKSRSRLLSSRSPTAVLARFLSGTHQLGSCSH